MKDELIENIRRAVVKDVETERVVYIMSQIRKLIERTGVGGDKYLSLKYWCDWAFHTELNRTFAREILKKMGDYILENPGDRFHWSDFNAKFVSLEALRAEMRDFFIEHGVVTDMLDIPRWNTFAKKLVDVLRDCPLTSNKGLAREFSFIRKSHIPQLEKYSIDYQIKFDGSRHSLEGSVLISDREIN